ncbi:hypothetical protein MTR67_011047 [Solanum verrucosum]|uniref:Uncharacterized protein n=1 Tax=Solanum verrucosum TaxID=315347 RepID=A0AAF0TER2_SOLVR|nr:hypothetical protein MTR67_011047 [Solanum verrucosum]
MSSLSITDWKYNPAKLIVISYDEKHSWEVKGTKTAAEGPLSVPAKFGDTLLNHCYGQESHIVSAKNLLLDRLSPSTQIFL